MIIQCKLFPRPNDGPWLNWEFCDCSIQKFFVWEKKIEEGISILAFLGTLANEDHSWVLHIAKVGSIPLSYLGNMEEKKS